MKNTKDYTHTRLIAQIVIIIVLMCAVLWSQGRIWSCAWDSPIYVWSSDTWSKHNSQHFFDPYFFTHVLHGFLFLWGSIILFSRIFGKVVPFSGMLLLAVFAEAVWEVFENSAFVIERYRENTASIEYFGDSIANSIGDVFACIIGFTVANRIGLRLSMILFFVIEVVLAITIRDSLLINILMLIYPIDAIRIWQTGG